MGRDPQASRGDDSHQRDPEVLTKFYDDLIPDLPRIPCVEEVSARATLEAMQAQG